MNEEFSKNLLAVWLRKTYEYFLAHVKQVLIVAAGILILIGLAIGYGYYRARRQEKAHKSFIQALKYFDAKVGVEEDFLGETKSFKTEEKKWEQTAKIFKKEYGKNRSAGIAPIFLAYQSEALVRLGKLDKAIEVLKKSLNLMEKDAALYSYYKVKLTLMQIDTGSKSLIDQAIASLKSMALEQNKPAHDMALYRLGEYFWYQKNYPEAKNYWNQLIIKYGKKSKHPSLWAQKAKEKLKLIQ